VACIPFPFLYLPVFGPISIYWRLGTRALSVSVSELYGPISCHQSTLAKGDLRFLVVFECIWAQRGRLVHPRFLCVSVRCRTLICVLLVRSMTCNRPAACLQVNGSDLALLYLHVYIRSFSLAASVGELRAVTSCRGLASFLLLFLAIRAPVLVCRSVSSIPFECTCRCPRAGCADCLSYSPIRVRASCPSCCYDRIGYAYSMVNGQRGLCVEMGGGRVVGLSTLVDLPPLPSRILRCAVLLVAGRISLCMSSWVMLSSLTLLYSLSRGPQRLFRC
jgi:hypothetical protein